jgi:hypothetical protein
LAYPDNKPRHEYHQYGYIKNLGLTKPPEHWFVGAEKPDAKITDGKETKKKEEKTTFGLKFSPKSPHYSKNYQIA